ncbi:hypothetical protein PCANB_002026 [Pneumocystis canis]|nr:hypothetical protein PCK1_001954 [Pneumocystis canis]KAG5439452.1 hypothetical protein PCANB_002026 [Pneumocystis canis]
MSEEAETGSISSSCDSCENPPLPDEPIPDTLPILNDEKSIINKDIPIETRKTLKSTSSSFLESTISTQLGKSNTEDDGWNAILDPKTQTYYFWNSKTNETTWKNPRISDDSAENLTLSEIEAKNSQEKYSPYKEYVFTARFNRMTGKWQNDPNKIPENFTEDARALRQQSFYFDVEATLASHDGRSFRAERRQKRLTKKELANYKKLNQKKKEQRKREWLLED